MAHRNTLDASRAILVVIDIQEAFREVIPGFKKVAKQTAKAVEGFQILGIPVLVTEQYPKGLGHTAAEIMKVLESTVSVIEKTAFSSCGASSFIEGLAGRDQVVIAGMETHICVNQTAHDLLDRSIQVHLLLDCVCSRKNRNRKAGMEKMLASGVVVSSVEMALFELLRDAKHEKFKGIQALIK